MPLSGQHDQACGLQANSDDYNCPICLDLLMEPVVALCGHEFCKQCCTNWVTSGVQRSSIVLACPLCRTALSRTVPGVCKRLAELIEATFPYKIIARREETERDRQLAAQAKPAQLNLPENRSDNSRQQQAAPGINWQQQIATHASPAADQGNASSESSEISSSSSDGTDQNNDIPLSPGTISQLDAHIAGSEHSSNAQSAAQPSPASPAHGPAAASDAPGSDENGIGPPECPLETLEDLDEVLSRFAPFFTWSDPFGSMTETGNVVTEPAPSPSFSPAVAHASQPTGSSIPQSARTQPQSQPGPGVHSSSNSGGRSTLGAAVWPPARVAPEAELSSMQHVQADTNSNVRPGSPVPHPQGNAMPTRTYVGQQAEFQTPTSAASQPCPSPAAEVTAMNCHASGSAVFPRASRQTLTTPSPAPHVVFATHAGTPEHQAIVPATVLQSPATSVRSSDFLQLMPPASSMAFTMGQAHAGHANPQQCLASQPPRFTSRARHMR